jgi:two-component system CheB/CheR fusion protein
LHDELQQRLFSIILQLTETDLEIQEAALEQARKDIAETKQHLQGAIQMTRDLSVDLSPPVLLNEGLIQALHWLATRMKEQYGFEVELQTDGTSPLPDRELGILLFQIVRELLFNVVKHAQVNHAQMIVTRTDSEIRVEIIDEGRGFLLDQVNQGASNKQGLQRVEQRLRLIGGRIDILTSPGAGTQVTLYTPLRINRGSDQ